MPIKAPGKVLPKPGATVRDAVGVIRCLGTVEDQTGDFVVVKRYNGDRPFVLTVKEWYELFQPGQTQIATVHGLEQPNHAG